MCVLYNLKLIRYTYHMKRFFTKWILVCSSHIRPLGIIEYVVAAILVLNFIVHIPFLSQPAIDTETSYYFAAKSIGDHHFNFFTPTYEEKPPLIFILPSILLRFSPIILWGRLQSLIFATIALICVYAIGKKIHSSSLGLMAVVMTVFYPMFAVQSVFFTDSMPETAVFLAMIYFAITQKRASYFFAGSFALLTKESLALMPILLYLYAVSSCVWKKEQRRTTSLVKNLYLLSPLFIFGCWLLLNKYFFGHIIYPGNHLNLLVGIEVLTKNYSHVARYVTLFVTHAGAIGIFGGTAILYMIFFCSKRLKINKTEIRYIHFFLCITLIYLFFYAQFFYWSLRYVLFLYPIVFLIFLRLLYEFFPLRVSTGIIIVTCGLFCLSQCNLLYATPTRIVGEAIDLRSIAQQEYIHKIVKEILSYDPNSTIYTDFQLAHYLWMPLFGYVDTLTKNVYQIQQPTAYNNCPTCVCSRCVSTDNLPHNTKILFVMMNGGAHPWIQPFLDKSLIIQTIKPDWPIRATDTFTVYEYFNPI